MTKVFVAGARGGTLRDETPGEKAIREAIAARNPETPKTLESQLLEVLKADTPEKKAALVADYEQRIASRRTSGDGVTLGSK